MNRSAFLLAPALLVGACSSPSGENTTAAATANESGTNYIAAVEALPKGQRDGVLLRAIRDADLDCQGVDRSAPATEVNGRPAWKVTCVGGKEFLVAIGADGNAQVIAPTGS